MVYWRTVSSLKLSLYSTILCSGLHKDFCSEKFGNKGCGFLSDNLQAEPRVEEASWGPPSLSFIIFHHENSASYTAHLLASAVSDSPSCCWWICSHAPGNPCTTLPCQLGSASGSPSLCSSAGAVRLTAIEHVVPGTRLLQIHQGKVCCIKIYDLCTLALRWRAASQIQ